MYLNEYISRCKFCPNILNNIQIHSDIYNQIIQIINIDGKQIDTDDLEQQISSLDCELDFTPSKDTPNQTEMLEDIVRAIKVIQINFDSEDALKCNHKATQIDNELNKLQLENTGQA